MILKKTAIFFQHYSCVITDSLRDLIKRYFGTRKNISVTQKRVCDLVQLVGVKLATGV